MKFKWLLGLGQQFVLSINKDGFSLVHTIANIEQFVQTIEDEGEKELTRNKKANVIMTYRIKIRNT